VVLARGHGHARRSPPSYEARPQAAEPAEARRILSRLEFHFTPKHASWLTSVEIEIGIMVRQCLNRRIPDRKTLISEIAAWERRRNAEAVGIGWMFTVDRAREKMGRVYPRPIRASIQSRGVNPSTRLWRNTRDPALMTGDDSQRDAAAVMWMLAARESPRVTVVPGGTLARE
jgi:hypothetical protein